VLILLAQYGSYGYSGHHSGVGPEVYFAVAATVVIFFIALWEVVARIRKSGPNEALVISGRGNGIIVDPSGKRRRVNFRVQRGATFIWPFVEKVDRISLETIPLDISIPNVATIGGARVTVEGSAQFKVGGDTAHIAAAAERFLNKSADEKRQAVSQVIEGHIRNTLSAMAVDDARLGPDALSMNVLDSTATDLGMMGIIFESFTIRVVKQ
jgi:flotillin